MKFLIFPLFLFSIFADERKEITCTTNFCVHSFGGRETNPDDDGFEVNVLLRQDFEVATQLAFLDSEERMLENHGVLGSGKLGDRRFRNCVLVQVVVFSCPLPVEVKQIQFMPNHTTKIRLLQ